MISIITGIYNQKSMNELFYHTLMENTHHPFELIIVDNNSNDGSKEFFTQKENVVLIENDGNFNYPYCQNEGLKRANFEWVCFFNNDILLPKDWDIKVLEIFKRKENLKVLSVATNDHLESKPAQKKIARKWKRIKYPIQAIFGNSKTALKLMVYLMYGDFQKFSNKRFSKWGYQLIEGYSGSAIISRRDFMESIGLWDERIQAADYDLFNRVKKISLKDSSVLPIQLALGIYFHHFQRLTLKANYPPFKNKATMISISEKWGNESEELRKDIV